MSEFINREELHRGGQLLASSTSRIPVAEAHDAAVRGQRAAPRPAAVFVPRPRFWQPRGPLAAGVRRARKSKLKETRQRVSSSRCRREALWRRGEIFPSPGLLAAERTGALTTYFRVALLENPWP